MRQRWLAQPAFHRERIAAYAEEVTEAERRSDLWVDGAEVDMVDEMTSLTFAIVRRTMPARQRPHRRRRGVRRGSSGWFISGFGSLSAIGNERRARAAQRDVGCSRA